MRSALGIALALILVIIASTIARAESHENEDLFLHKGIELKWFAP